jgi:CheY-like chemotaxis protein
MTPASRASRSFTNQQARSDGADALPAGRREYVRIARALLGVTPAQLAAHIGVTARPPLTADTAHPAQTLDRLGSALQAVIGWYHDALGNQPAEPVAATNLNDLVQTYITLRSSWENREASAIAARMTQLSAPGFAALAAPATTTEQAALFAETPRPRALLVDDASDVVITVGAFLEAFGFDVRRAANGDTALAILADGTRVDLLVSDHAMPGMTGKDLVTQACQQRPELRALIITGYPDAQDLAQLPTGVMLLAKPFRRLELAECIHRLFAGRVSDETSRATLQEADGS